MIRVLRVTVLLVSAGEVLVLHWAALTFGSGGLSLAQAFLGITLLATFNFSVLPWVRSRIRATGVTMVLSRTWLLGSVAALLTGLLLAAVFVVVGGGASIADLGSSGRLALGWSGGVTLALGFGSVLWGASVGSYRVRVDRVDLPARSISPRHGALRIAHVTDLHIGPLLRPPRLREFVDRINRLEAGLVVITGDLFDFDPEFVEAGCRELGRLQAPHGVYAVLGNHDVYTGADAVADGIERRTSIRLLRDEWECIDIAGAPGTDVIAPARGRVVFAGKRGPLGNSVTIDHGYGIRTIYGHTKEIFVKRGQEIQRGQVIAALGNTGRSTGPHLHYVVEVRGKAVNPLDYIFD